MLSPLNHHFSWLNLIKTTIFAGPVPPPPTAARSCRETFWEPGTEGVAGGWPSNMMICGFKDQHAELLNWGYLVIGCIINFSLNCDTFICICGPTNYIQYHTIGRSSYSDETSWNLLINASKTDGIIWYNKLLPANEMQIICSIWNQTSLAQISCLFVLFASAWHVTQ